MKIAYLAALIAGGMGLGYSGAATADEQWTSDGKTIIYELDEGDMAVLSVDGTTIYIEGLAGVYQDRGTYGGIWMLDEAPMVENEAGELVPAEGCGFSMLRPGKSGETSEYWGQVEITFIDANFPSVWIGYFGDCFDPLSDTMIARPIAGE